MQTHHIFQTFVERLAGGQDADSFRDAMAEAAASFDLPSFAYARMTPDTGGLATLISTYPVRWTDRYVKSRYETVDPVICASYRSTEPFEWGEDVHAFALTPRQEEFFEEASSFGIRCGFTIPIQDRAGPVAAVTFASSERRESFRQSVRANARVLQLMAICLHAHARRKLWPSRLIGGKQMSPREMECLIWAAKGKSAWATAKILGISASTVRFHLGNVRTKLDVTTLRQAIALLDGTQGQ